MSHIDPIFHISILTMNENFGLMDKIIIENA